MTALSGRPSRPQAPDYGSVVTGAVVDFVETKPDEDDPEAAWLRLSGRVDIDLSADNDVTTHAIHPLTI